MSRDLNNPMQVSFIDYFVDAYPQCMAENLHV